MGGGGHTGGGGVKKSLATCSVVLWRWRKRLIHGERTMAQITQGGSPLPKARIGDSSLVSTPTAPPDRFSHDRGSAFPMGCRRQWFGRLGRWRRRPTPFDREVHTPSTCPYWRWLMGERSHGATRQIFSRSRKRFPDGMSEAMARSSRAMAETPTPLPLVQSWWVRPQPNKKIPKIHTS